MTTTLTTVPNERARRAARSAERRDVIAGIPAVEYEIFGDTFGIIPHVVLDLRRATDLHHNTRAALARRIGRAVWGELAEPIHLGGGRYELVWCGSPVPLPDFMEARYGQYRARGLAEL